MWVSLLLQLEQDFAIVPELFQTVIITLLGCEEMHDRIANIHHEPTVFGMAFDAGWGLELLVRFLADGVCQGVQHPVAGTGANNKIVSEGSYFMNVQKDNIFTFSLF